MRGWGEVGSYLQDIAETKGKCLATTQMLKTMISVGANKSLIYNLKRMLDSSVAKESACIAGDLGSIPGLGRSPGEGKRYPLQYSGLENSRDGIVHGIAKSWT